MKKLLATAALLLLVLAGVYFGSPLYAARALQQAALAGDSAAIAARVDFPAVRESLKPQLGSALQARVARDPHLQGHGGALAALGMMLLPRLADEAVDLFVTPEGIAALMRGRRPGGRHAGEANPDVDRNAEFDGLDHFVVRLRDRKKYRDGPAFRFERRGFASWKLVRVDLPPSMLDEQPSA